ncbi:hypothetical protein NECID01_1015 [Nematocida sp. AWRm77]|nr:hypothetical protein NECID01_1015 [Nematocida sp. AWRm77]
MDLLMKIKRLAGSREGSEMCSERVEYTLQGVYQVQRMVLLVRSESVRERLQYVLQKYSALACLSREGLLHTEEREQALGDTLCALVETLQDTLPCMAQTSPDLVPRIQGALEELFGMCEVHAYALLHKISLFPTAALLSSFLSLLSLLKPRTVVQIKIRFLSLRKKEARRKACCVDAKQKQKQKSFFVLGVLLEEEYSRYVQMFAIESMKQEDTSLFSRFLESVVHAWLESMPKDSVHSALDTLKERTQTVSLRSALSPSVYAFLTHAVSSFLSSTP